MENIKRILTKKLRPILLHIIGEKSYKSDLEMQSDIDYLKSLSENNLKFIEDANLRQWVLGTSNTIIIYRNKLDASIIKFMIEDSVNIFKVYEYLNDLNDNSKESYDTIDNYIKFVNLKMDEESIDAGRKFGRLLSLSKYNRTISVNNITINDLEKFIKDDLRDLFNLSSDLNNYRIDDLKLVEKSLDSYSKETNVIDNELESALDDNGLTDHDKVDRISRLAMSDRYKDLDISKNILYLLNHPVTSLMSDKGKMESIMSLVNQYKNGGRYE